MIKKKFLINKILIKEWNGWKKKGKNNIQNIYFLLLGQTPLEMANAFETPNQEIIEALKVFG